MTTDLVQGDLSQVRRQVHANCIVCGQANERGLGLDFALSDDGSVEADFNCDKAFEGYASIVHGGVISSVLDGAMTSCLFARGCSAVTAALDIRFRHPVMTGQTAAVHAWVTRSTPPVYVLKAEVSQQGQVKATATGTLMEQPELASERRIDDEPENTCNNAG